MFLLPPGLAIHILLLLSLGAQAAEPIRPTLQLTPSRLEMDSFYGGGSVRIEGMAAPGAQVVVVVRGADKEETFNRRARFGPIWATAGKVHISGVPSLFLCFSPKPVHDLVNRETIVRRMLDTVAIQRQMRIESAQSIESDDVIRSNYLALKIEEGVYRVDPSGVKMGQPEADGVPYTVEFQWPKKAPPATYEVKALQCWDGAVVAESSTPLEVVKVGFPARLSVLANDRAPLYGALSVLVAAIAGFGIDFLAARLFGKKRRVAH